MNPNTIKEMMDALELVPSKERMDAFAADVVARGDSQLAPIWAEKLRHTFTKVLETEYPELMAENGEVLPIDTSVGPASLSWEYFMVDQRGYADWIDDDGEVAPNSALTATRHTGTMEDMGHKYDWTIFELERFSAVGQNLSNLKLSVARRAHAEKTNYTWLFSDASKGMLGLVNHPNITVEVAPLNVGATSRKWADKTNDEILTDVSLFIDPIPVLTIGAHHVSTVFMSRQNWQLLRNRRLGAGDGFSSLLDLIKNRYSGDESGQPGVTFRILNECDPALRINTKTGTDTSGVVGDFIIALPKADIEVGAFVRARPFTQMAPQERDMKVFFSTHSKIGGCKITRPLAFIRFDFGA